MYRYSKLRTNIHKKCTTCQAAARASGPGRAANAWCFCIILVYTVVYMCMSVILFCIIWGVWCTERCGFRLKLDTTTCANYNHAQ